MLLGLCVVFFIDTFLFVLVGHCLPVPDSGPHIINGWGKPVRLRHLYTTNSRGLVSYYLQINEDGRVDGTTSQSAYSLLEIRPVSSGSVAIKGVKSYRYLCMDKHGKLHGSHTYTKEDCSFVERILPGGYNVYTSEQHKDPVSLSSIKQRLQSKWKGLPPLSQFLPMVSTIPEEPVDFGFEDLDQPSDLGFGLSSPPETDSMDPFGTISRIYMQSPSFHKK
ncbi:fibroblast growth factor 19-like [Huso huso]|uniref:Fibroblast growth factor n=1 Tax=Huso huso TaxID=61971 RepID=A0ABR0YK26_HUSHU